MSVLIEFSMFPMDVGESVGGAVSGIVKMIRSCGHAYHLTAMGTIVETAEIREALDLVEKSYRVLATEGSKRVYASIKMDIREGKEHRLTGKIQSIETRIGNVNK